MTHEELRSFCLSLPHATEDVKWGNDLCFLIAEKMFAITILERSEGHFLTCKCDPERFAELIEVDGIRPSVYLARSHWLTVQRGDVLRDSELKELIRGSYDLVFAKLPKRMQAELSTDPVRPGREKPGHHLAKKRARRATKKPKASR